MHAFSTLAFLALLLASHVHASVYVTNPIQSTTCTGGQSCQVQWVDNGQSPLLTDIGECDVGLYTGELVLAQSLTSVDVSTTSSFTFTPDPAVGPSGQYYIVFTASGVSYQGFSGSFTLTGMSGTTPGGGSSAPVSTPATTSAGSSISAGSSTPGTSPTDTATASGTSTPVVGTTTPTGSTSAVDTTAATPTPSVITPPLSATPISATTPTTTPTTTSSKTSTSTSASVSATATSAAGRAGSSTSLGSVAALLVLFGVLSF